MCIRMRMISCRIFNLSFKSTQLFGARNLHHSATNGKFYTNRYYVKKCSKCRSVNSLTLLSCFNCSNKLTDSDIRFRSLDHICEVSNARKNIRPPGYFNAKSSVFSNSDSYISVKNSGKAVEYGTFNDIDASNGTRSSSEEELLSPLVLYRCFDFTIILNKTPSAFVHLSAFPNGTFYDIKNFRKSHVELINKMTDRCLSVFTEIVQGNVHVPDIDRLILDNLKARVAKGINEKNKMINESLKNVVWGFIYPNTHCHVDMHALLPPIASFNLFKSPFFYTLEKVLGDLRNFGRVRQYSPTQIREMNEFDEVMEQVKKSDVSMREYLEIA